jgi:hypothetical protein
MGNLFAALAAHKAGKTAVIVAAMAQAVRLKMILGALWDIDILISTAMPAGTIAAIEVASFVSGFGSTVEYDVSKVAAVHMEDTSPQDITGGTPSPAVPVKSLFQIDAIGLKAAIQASWGMRASGHVAWIQNTTW